jgi:AcrR family transcriptional regulator
MNLVATITPPEALPATQPHGARHDSVAARSARRDAQTARIVEAARACFKASGFHGASMSDICNAAGMSPGALYRYFPSKESLVEAICAADREEDANILKQIADADDVVEGMVGGLLAHVMQVHRSGMAPLFSEIFAEAQRNPVIEGTLQRSMCDAERVIFDSLAKAQAKGEIDPVAPLPLLLQTMMAMGHGLVTHDLPRLGITPDMMTPVIRAMVMALLRPATTEPAAK